MAILKLLYPKKLIKSLADIAEHIYAKLKEDLIATFSWNVLMSISLLVAIVIKGLKIWGSKCHQNNSPVVCDGFMWSMSKQKLID